MPRKPGPDHKLEPFYSSGCPPKNAAQHGTLTMYQRHACRCRECKLAQQAYSRRRRADYRASVDTEAYLATLRAKAKAESARAAEIAQAKADWDEIRARFVPAPLVETGFDELGAHSEGVNQVGTGKDNAPGGKCFACDKRLGANPKLVQSAVDQQTMYVGSDCYKRILAAGEAGYQPPLGGPRLKAIPIKNPFAGTVRWTKRSRSRNRGW